MTNNTPSQTIGIDLGTTNSCVSVMEGGKPVVIANAEGARTTPSVVAFGANGERLVGQLAVRQAVMNPANTISSAKRFIGRHLDEIGEEASRVPYEVVAGPGGAARIVAGGKQHAPEEISAQVLRKLADDAAAYLGQPVTKAVITVPAYFSDAQRTATRDAGRIAGLDVVRVVNEPTAAALAYGLDGQGRLAGRDGETVMVFDLGGGTFDVSVLEIGEGVCEVRSTSGDTHLGGDDFDQRIVDFLAHEFRTQNGIDLRQDPQALQRLAEAARTAKHELSATSETRVSLPFITADQTGAKHLEQTLSRAKFDDLTRELVGRCRGPVERALADAKLSAADIDKVILVGGSTRMPAVQALVKQLSGGRDPSQSVNPDEVVAIGAAVQAGVLSGETTDVLLLDVTPLSLGVETEGGLMHRLIERNTTIPARRSEVFSTAVDGQPAVDVVVIQGEREMAGDNKILGQFKLDGVRKARRGEPRVEVTFDIDANGILSVSARDQDTGKEQTITVTGSIGLDQSEIDHMVRDAESNAAADRARRERAEAKNAADAALYAADRRLDDVGDTVPAADRANLERLQIEVRDALQDESRPTDEVRRRVEELAQATAALEPSAPVGAGVQSDAGGPSGDDVIDADYTVT